MARRYDLQTQAIHSELLELLRIAELEKLDAAHGTLTRRKVRGRHYWYLRRRVADRIQETYLGPDDETLRARLDQIRAAAEDAKTSLEKRRRLVRMLRAAGHPPLDRRLARVLEELEVAGVFRHGGVLVGTHALRCYGGLLGVRVETTLASTNDLDVAHPGAVRVALPEAEVSLAEALARAERFLPIPQLDPRAESTSWRTRDHEIFVDVLTPMRGRADERPKKIRSLGVHATPLRYLDYLLEEVDDAAVLTNAGVLVRVPRPERFALHKLIVAQERGSGTRDRARKDVEQAAFLLRVLLDDRPDDLADAWANLVDRGTRWRRGLERGGGRLPGDLWTRVREAAEA